MTLSALTDTRIELGYSTIYQMRLPSQFPLLPILPSRVRILRTFLGEMERRVATREIFFPSFSQTRGITSSANCSVICWKLFSPVTPCDQERNSGSMLPLGTTFCLSN